MSITDTKCSVEGCERYCAARGWCDLHYRRWLRNGDLESRRIVGDDLARFESKVKKGQPKECWEWQAGHSAAGYGVFLVNGSMTYSHRFSHTHFKGKIPKGFHVDHLCRNVNCCNPEHLEAVPPKENHRRGIKGVLTTHCPQGHEYSQENTFIGKEGWRRCRTCHRERERERKVSRQKSES